MKITRKQLRKIIKEAESRFASKDHYVGGVRMTGPGADNIFGKRKRDDRSIEERIKGMGAKEGHDLIVYALDVLSMIMGPKGIEKAVAEGMEKVKARY